LSFSLDAGLPSAIKNITLLPADEGSSRIMNQMAEILNIDEIKSRYNGEWVLIGDPVADQSLTVVRGSVLWHSKDRDEVYCKARELKPVHSAILFFGHLPKDAAIVL
jgi:hypothetical protein